MPSLTQLPPWNFLARCLAALRTLPEGVMEPVFGLPEPLFKSDSSIR